MSEIPRFIRGRGNNFNNGSDYPLPNSVSPSFAELHRDISAIGRSDVGWEETPEVYSFKIGLPGLKREEVKVTIEDDLVLHIIGERNMEKRDPMRPNIGRFMTRFRLPHDAKMHKMKTKMENGLLFITIPK